MSEIALSGGTLAQSKADLMAQFVAYIDRSPKTTSTYLTNLRQYAAWLRHAGIEQPERASIILYREWLAAEHEAIKFSPVYPGWKYQTDRNGNRRRITCKPNTVKQYLQSVKQFYAWAASEGIIAADIAKGIHGPKVIAAHRKDSLTAEEVRQIEDSIDRTTEKGKRLFAMFQLAVNAGLRTVEISRANIRDIESKNGKACIFIWGKGHPEADTRKPIAHEVYEAIRAYIEARTDAHTAGSPLFVATGNRSGGQRLAPTTISTMLKQAMIEAGYNSERLTAHSLRHTTGQNVMKITGRNIYETQQYMRHSNPATTEIYLDNDTAQQDEDIARKLYAYYHGRTIRSNEAEKLADAVGNLNPEQLAQLTAIAEAMKKGGAGNG